MGEGIKEVFPVRAGARRWGATRSLGHVLSGTSRRHAEGEKVGEKRNEHALCSRARARACPLMRHATHSISCTWCPARPRPVQGEGEGGTREEQEGKEKHGAWFCGATADAVSLVAPCGARRSLSKTTSH